MLKFINLEDIKLYKNWFLCHDITINDKTFGKDMQINDVIVRYFSSNITPYNINNLIIVGNTPQEDNTIRELINSKVKDLLKYEIKESNKRYYDIITDDFKSRIELLVLKAFNELDLKYTLNLILSPIILKKSLSLCILSFYFGIKLNVKYKELDDLIYSSLLVNLNLCRNNDFNNIKDKNFLIGYKSSLIKTSYELIKDDKHITNNVKRIVKYANIVQQNRDDLYHRTNEEGKKETLLRDVTLEILQLSNDILTYSMDDNFKRLYLTKNHYSSIITPALNIISNEIISKKNMLEKNKFSLFKERLRKFLFGENKEGYIARR